jgi:hypothetical protein
LKASPATLRSVTRVSPLSTRDALALQTVDLYS